MFFIFFCFQRWQRRWFVLYEDGELTYSVDEHVGVKVSFDFIFCNKNIDRSLWKLGVCVHGSARLNVRASF